MFVGRRVVFINDHHPNAIAGDGSIATGSGLGCHSYLRRTIRVIGSGAVILCGVEVGEESMIGAGRLITKSVKPYEIVAGNPARVPHTKTKNE